MCIRCLVAKGVSRDARNMEHHIRQWNAGLRGRYSLPFSYRDVSRQGSNQSGVPSPSSPLDCPIGRMFPVSPTSGFPLFSLSAMVCFLIDIRSYKLHNFMDFIFEIVCLCFTINFNLFVLRFICGNIYY